MIAEVRDAPPPSLLVTPLNLVNRWFLRSRLAGAVPGLALLEFRGRRTGRLYRVPVGWHLVHGDGVVVTPAPWRANFAPGWPVTVHHRGRSHRCIGTLATDPSAAAAAINELLDAGTKPWMLGLSIPPGHRLRDDDAAAMDRAVIRFRSA